jgi:hypothetical protein
MDIADLAAFSREWLDNLSTDLLRYVVFAVGVWRSLWVLLARPLAAHRPLGLRALSSAAGRPAHVRISHHHDPS